MKKGHENHTNTSLRRQAHEKLNSQLPSRKAVKSNGLRSYLISNEKSNFDSMSSINLGSRNLISENVLWKNRPKVSSGIIKIPVKFSLSFQNQKQKLGLKFKFGLIDRSSCRCRFQRIFLPVQAVKFTPAGAGSSTLEITKTNFVCSPPVRHPFPTKASKHPFGISN